MAWGRVFSIQSGNYLMAVTRIQDQMAATRIQSASNLNSPGFPRIAPFAILGFTRNRVLQSGPPPSPSTCVSRRQCVTAG